MIIARALASLYFRLSETGMISFFIIVVIIVIIVIIIIIIIIIIVIIIVHLTNAARRLWCG